MAIAFAAAGICGSTVGHAGANPNPNPTRVYVVSALATGISPRMLDTIMQCTIPMVPDTTIGCGMGEER